MRSTILILVAGLLGACAHTAPPAPLPPVVVSGPVFAATDFETGEEPMPPDPAAVGKRGGSAGAHYENRLSQWGGACRLKLGTVGRRLNAAGLVRGAQ